MPDLFSCLMKEEWRMHSTMFGSISFALFPVMIFGIVFMGSFLLPLLSVAFPAGDLAFLAHASFLLLGFMVGGFGLLGNEMMNRRFGQASLLVYSSRNLPLSERFIFTNFVVKDIVYYFFLWVLPFGGGYIAASPFLGIPLSRALLLLLTLSLSFLLGLCVVFLLSSLYVRSKTACFLAVIVPGIAGGVYSAWSGTNPALLFPPYLLYSGFSWMTFLGISIAIAALFTASVVLFSPEGTGSTRTYGRMLGRLAKVLSFLPQSPIVAKDFLDLSRSGIGIGQALFSFLIPLVVIWFFLSLLESSLPPHGLIVIFSLTTGIIASTIYTWVTEFDSFGPYSCLPLSVSTLIAGKMTTFLLLQALPAVFIGAVTGMSSGPEMVAPAVVLCISISVYAASVMAFLCGLFPGVLVYDVRVLFTYLVLDGVALAILAAISFASSLYAFLSVFLLVPAYLFSRAAGARWDARDTAGV
ncbi:MAG: hypothetical protein QHH04_00465 [Methanolinea sp.]|nr:hypothetical protein [Methanolinea sp.]